VADDLEVTLGSTASPTVDPIVANNTTTVLNQEINVPEEFNLGSLQAWAVFADGDRRLIGPGYLDLTTDNGQTVLEIDAWPVPEGEEVRTVDVSVDDVESITAPTNTTEYLTTDVELNADVSSLDQVTALIRWQNGTTTQIPPRYLSLDTDFDVSTDPTAALVSIDEYPVPASAGVASLNVFAATDQGATKFSDTFGSATGTGPPLDIESFAVSSLRPGPSEAVTIRAFPEADAGVELADVNVRGPDGRINHTQTSDRSIRFTTNGSGRYVTEWIFEVDGEQSTRRFAVTALDTSRSTPPSVRERKEVDRYAVAEGLRKATISTNRIGSETTVTAVLREDQEVPREIHVYPLESASTETDLTVNVVRGRTEQSVSERVRVVVHLAPMDEESVVYRLNAEESEQPLEVGDNEWGVRDHSTNRTLIRTTTDQSGTVTVRTIRKPSFFQRGLFAIRSISLPDFVPFGTVTPAVRPSATGGPLADLAGALGGDVA
jgi:hypothetical protein